MQMTTTEIYIYLYIYTWFSVCTYIYIYIFSFLYQQRRLWCSSKNEQTSHPDHGVWHHCAKGPRFFGEMDDSRSEAENIQGAPGALCCSCSVTQSCPSLCDPMDCSTPGLPVLHHLLEFAQTHIHGVGNAIQPSYPLSSPPVAFNLSQHQGLFRWFGSSHQMAKVLELQLQHQSFQWTGRVDFLRIDLFDFLAV